MPAETVEWIIGRALTDLAYRQRLLGSPDEALVGYDLTAEQTIEIKAWTRQHFDDLICQLEENVAQASFDGAVGFDFEHDAHRAAVERVIEPADLVASVQERRVIGKPALRLASLDSAERLASTLADGPLTADKARPSFDEMIATGQRFVDLGVIRQIHDATIDCEGLRLHTSCVLYGGAYGRTRYVVPSTCGGNGFTREEARERAVGEAAERFCGAVYDERAFTFECRRNLGDDAVPAAHFALFSEQQYREDGFAFRPFTEEARVNWVWGYSLLRRSPVLVPAAFVYRPYWPVGGETPIGLMPTTGLACGGSLAEATLNGACEVVERDAIMIMWLNRLPAPRLDLADARFPFVERLPGTGPVSSRLRLSVHDITTDIRIPTRFALLIDDHHARPIVGAGAAARWQPDAALEKATAEALLLRAAIEKAIRTNHERDYGPQFSDVRTLDDRMLLFSDRRMLPELNFLLTADQAAVEPNAPDQMATGVLQNLGRCLRALDEAGLDVIVVDVTLPEIADAGLCVVRVIVPGMIPLNVAERQICKGAKRLYRAPQAMGYLDRETTEQELNPVPHPFI
jgi:ribosomal protein S12 methylthiotransferase accessory factor